MVDIHNDERFCSICDIQPIKVGFYEPYCDDQRFSIQKIYFCSDTYSIIIGGAAGNVLIFKLKFTTVSRNKITVYKYYISTWNIT